MDSLLDYGSEGETVAPAESRAVIAAPGVEHTVNHSAVTIINPTLKMVEHNPKFTDMWLPAEGPSNPYHTGGLAPGQKNTLTGYVEKHEMNNFSFTEQYHTFHNWGHAANPSDAAGHDAQVGQCSHELGLEGGTVFSTTHKMGKKRRVATGDPGDLEAYRGPWAPLEGEDKEPEPMTEEQIAYLAEKARTSKRRQRRPEVEPIEEKSMLHVKEEFDYQGRTFISPPSDLKPGPHDCYIPKKWEHTWSGHSKGVAAIRFFPKYGHLLLSAGMDSKVKIWDVYNTRKCVRTYLGHDKAVRDICFTNDGKQFLTCSYDKFVKLWDTETGQCIGSYTTKKTPLCSRFNPGMENVFIMGCSDKKLCQFDINTGKQEQVYDHHLAAVNTVTFVDDNRRFVSTSDDKKIFVWEFGIPVPINYISDPNMHSMPAVSLSPNGNFFLGQSLDNQIITYTARRKFSVKKNKNFKGHICAGYAIQPNMSPDMQWVISGDSDGMLFFWDWKTCKVFRKMKAHEGVCIGAEWHPVETSKVATCGWDGLIKFWD